MTRAAVTWLEGDRLRLAEARENETSLISRQPNAAIFLADPTVSRMPHAAIRGERDAFFVDHLRGEANRTRVNGSIIDRLTPLSDKDAVQVGSVRLVFHDLATADRVRLRMLCSHCRRENEASRADCWYCGTSLANAPSTMSEHVRVACRVVSAGGENYDVYAGDVFMIRRDFEGVLLPKAQLPADALLAIEVRDERPVLLAFSSDSALRLNDAAPSDGQALKSGDTLHAGDNRFILIVR